MTDIPDCRITRDAVYIGGQKLPGFILNGGVYPMCGGREGLNTVAVVFVVADVTIDDPLRITPCACERPWDPGVIHRTDGPCYLEEQR